eukprot:GEMP01048828.1.p1 GENE.GEMP01048828.1~~GEMP01048828.1.p1  ORF type:complete len:384 (+),score=91.04 GEMP01048828.1:158-1309(+)
MSTGDRDHLGYGDVYASDGDDSFVLVNAFTERERAVRSTMDERHTGPHEPAGSIHADERHTGPRARSVSSSRSETPSLASPVGVKPEKADHVYSSTNGALHQCGCVLSANVDEAERCMDDANLLLLGASSWPEEARLEMIYKATRLLRKAHNMSKMTIQSVPQWLTMRGAASSAHGLRNWGPRIPANTIQEAIRLYAREEARAEVTPSASSHREEVHEPTVSDQEDQEAFVFIREAWSKLHYVVFDMTGLGRFFAQEWKTTILVIYLLVVLLALARYANQAPLWTLFYGARQPTQLLRAEKPVKPPPLHQSGASSSNREDWKWTYSPNYAKHAAQPLTGEEVGVTDFVAERVERGEWYYSPPLLSWLAFFVVPFIINHFQTPN